MAKMGGPGGSPETAVRLYKQLAGICLESRRGYCVFVAVSVFAFAFMSALEPVFTSVFALAFAATGCLSAPAALSFSVFLLTLCAWVFLMCVVGFLVVFPSVVVVSAFAAPFALPYLPSDWLGRLQPMSLHWRTAPVPRFVRRPSKRAGRKREQRTSSSCVTPIRAAEKFSAAGLTPPR